MTKPLHNKKSLLVTLLVVLISAFFLQIGLSFSNLKEKDVAKADETFIEIRTARDLADFAEIVEKEDSGANARLLANIDLKGAVWTPIGPTVYYTGTFDGNGYSISNMIIDSSFGNMKIGLFSEITGAAHIKNLQINNPSITSSSGIIGVVVGSIYQSGKISNVAVNGGSVLYSGTGSGKVGGLVGNVSITPARKVTITNSYSTAELGKFIGATGSVETAGLIGGVSGIDVPSAFELKNVYYNGTSYGATKIYGLINTKYTHTIRNAYSVWSNVGSTTTHGYQIYDKDGTNTSQTNLTTRTAALDKIKAINISTDFHSSTTVALENYQHNWFIKADKIPLLRGVGNKFMAIKTQDFQYVDFLAEDNGGFETAEVADTNKSVTVWFEYTKQEDLTWKTYSVYTALSGQAGVGEQVVSNTNSSLGRYQKREISITVNEKTGAQGYYIVNFTLTTRLYKMSLSIADLKDNQFAAKSGTSDAPALPGKIMVKNAETSGDVYTTISSNGSQDVKIANGSWSSAFNFSNNAIDIYVDKDAKLYFNAKANVSTDDYYHDLFVRQEYSPRTSSFSRLEYLKDEAVSTAKKDAKVYLFVSDLYELKYLTESYLSSLDAQQKEQTLNDIIFANTKKYDRAYGIKSEKSVYMSYSTGKIYTKTNNFSYSEVVGAKLLQTNSNDFYTKGYKLTGWGIKGGDGVIAITNTSLQSIASTTTNGVLESVRPILLALLQEITVEGKNINVANSTYLHAIWGKTENYAYLYSMINLADEWKQQTIADKITSSTLFEEDFFYWHSDFNDAKVKATNANNQSGSNSVLKDISVNTEESLKLEIGQAGYAIRLKAFIIYNGSDFSTLPTANLGGVNATFNQEHELGNNKWFYDLGEETSVNINDIYGDIIIIAVYQRDPSTINISVSPTQPSEDTVIDFSLDYEVFEINGTIVKEGTLTQQNPQGIQGVLFLQTIVFKNLTINSVGYKIDALTESTKIKVGPNNPDFSQIEKLQIIYDTENENWSIGKKQLAIAADKVTGIISQQPYILYLKIPVVFEGISFEIYSAYLDGEELKLLTSSGAPQFSALTATVPPTGLNPQLTVQSAKNFSLGTTFTILMNKLNIWKPKIDGSNYVVYVDDGEGARVFSKLKFQGGPHEFTLSDFDDFDEGDGKIYKIYIVMEKVKYTVKVEFNQGQEGFGTVSKGGVIGSQFEIEFDELLSLQAVAKTGYKISSLRLEQNDIEEFVGLTKTINFDILLSDYFDENDDLKTNLTLKLEFAPDNSQYIVEYHLEELDGSYTVETETISNNIKVDQQVTVYARTYTYFVVVGNASQTGIVTPIEQGVFKFVFTYNRKTYQIIYDSNGGSPNQYVEPSVVKYGALFKVSSNPFTKTGYDFVNWKINGRTQEIITYPAENLILSSSLLTRDSDTSITILAMWTIKKYTITFTATDADAASNTWDNRTGYTVNVSKQATIEVSHGHIFNDTNLIKPVREGYNFDGWYTTPSGAGTKINGNQITGTQTELFARWTASIRTINYYANLEGASLNFDSKFVLVDGTFGENDAKGEMVNGVVKTGFPVATAPTGFVFEGWYLSSNPAQAGTKLTNLTALPAGTSNLSVYAHWKVADVVIRVPAIWKSTFTFNGSLNNTLKIATQTSTTDAYIQNASAGLSYTFTWKKSDNTLVGQTEQGSSSTLKLQNVSQSGFYKVAVKATHAIWGESGEVDSGLGEVEIRKSNINVSATLENGIISKTYDATTAVSGVATDKLNVLRASAVFADANAGEGKVVIFTLTFQPGHLPENYDIYYKNILIANPQNQTSFTFQDATAQIKKDSFTVSLGALQGKMTGLAHTLAANKLTLTQQVASKLLGRNQKLDGYVKTNDYNVGVYQAIDFINALKVVDIDNVAIDLTNNYIITLQGSYEIIDGEMKALQISKKGFYDKDTSTSQTAFAPAFTILVNNVEYNASGSYEIGGKVMVVSNEANSEFITILAEPNSDLRVTLVAPTYNVLVGQMQTVAVAKHWNLSGQETLGQTFTFNFATLGSNQSQTVEMFYINYSTINYSTRITGYNDAPSQKVYNTANGITVSHPTLSQTGLVFKGWFTSTGENKQPAQINWKGVGEFNLFADWELENLQVKLEKEDGTILEIADINQTLLISQVYDSSTHSIEAKVQNQNNTSSVSYSYQWLLDEEDASTQKFYSYKDVTYQNLKINVSAILTLGGQQSDRKDFVLKIRLEVLPKQFTYEGVVEKVYDGTKTIKANGENFILIDIPTGGQIETLKLVGEYATYEAGENINLVNFKAVDYNDFKASNFQITLPTVGRITKKIVSIIDFGDHFTNNKVYNGSVLTKTTQGKFSTDILDNHDISVTFRTTGANAGMYSVEDQTIEVVSYDILQAGVSVLKNYDVQAFVGSAQILKAVFNSSVVNFSGSTTVLYNGAQHFVYASNQWPTNLTVVYTWKNKLDDIVYSDAIKPVDAGEYEITLDLNLEETNYEVVGAKVFTATLIISKRQVTIFIGNHEEFTYGQRTLNISSQDPTFLISNYTLVSGHSLTGTITTQGSLPGKYSEENFNITKNFVVKDAANNDITRNYDFKVDGSIKITHTYTIVFNSNGGTGHMNNQVVEYGQTVSLFTNTYQNYGYTFISWNTLANGTGITYTPGQTVSSLGPIHGDVINLYAIWNPNPNTRYKIEFFKQDLSMLEDGISPENAYLSSGEVQYYEAATDNYLVFEAVKNNGIIIYYTLKVYLNKAAFDGGAAPIKQEVFNPTREGFTFVEHQNEKLTGSVVANPIEENWLTIKIYLSRNTYTLTLKKNTEDGSDQFVGDLTYWYEQKINQPADPTRQGYVFDGWFINFENPDIETKKVNWSNFTMPSEDVVLWALYTARQDTFFDIEVYEQVLDKANLSYTLTRTTPNLQAKTNAEIRIEFVKEGEEDKIVVNMYEGEGVNAGAFIKQIATLLYNYEGFFVNQSFGELIGKASPTDKLVLKVYYLREQYQVTVKTHNGVQDTVSTELYGTNMARFANPTYQGYVFEDWYLEFDEGTGSYSNRVSQWPYIIKENTTFHAKYTPGTETPFTINIFLQTLSGNYPAVPNQTKTIKSTTDLEGRFSAVTENGQTYFEVKFFKNADLKFALEKFVFNGFEINADLTQNAHVNHDGTGVLNAYLARKEYTITFNLKDAEEDNQTFFRTKVFEGELTQAEANSVVFNRQGYRFGGWFFSEDFVSENAVAFPYIVTKDIEFYGRWFNAEETEYTLEIYLQSAFDDGYPAEASIIQNNVFAADSTIEIFNQSGFVLKITNPINAVFEIIRLDITGYTLNNSLTQMTENYIHIEGTTVIRLYYTINSYNFIVEDDGQILHQEIVKFEQVPTYDEVLTKQGYNQVGWVIKGIDQIPYVKNAFKMPAKDVTINPVWQRATNTSYTIVYHIQNVGRTSFDEYKVIDTRKTTTLNYLTLEGNTFKVYDINKTTLFADQNLEIETIKGFTLNGSLSPEWVEVAPDGSAVFNLYFERNEYTITLNFKDNLTPNQVFANQVYGSFIEWPAPTRLGYTFKGWFFDENEMLNQAVWVPKENNPSVLLYLVDENRTMFAKWQANSNTPYKVEHYIQNKEDNGYTLYAENMMAGVTDTEASIDILNITGFVFNETASPKLKGNIEPDGSLVLVAYYDRQVYTLNFNGNLNTAGQMEAISFRFEQQKLLPQNEFVKDGYNFVGWTDRENSIVLKYIDQALYTFNKTENATLYALWEIKTIENASLTALDGISQVQYGNKIVLEATYTHLSNHIVSYKWFKDGAEIGMGASTLELTEINQSGTYHVVIYVEAFAESGSIQRHENAQTNSVSVVITKRQVEFSATSFAFIYNALSQTPTITLNYTTGAGISAPTESITMPSFNYEIWKGAEKQTESKNVGSYVIKAILQANANFELVGAFEWNYEINPLQWDISSQIAQGEFFKHFSIQTQPDPVLEKTIKNESTNEDVLVTFTRVAGEKIGFYNLQNTSTQNTNYQIFIQSENNGFEIKMPIDGEAIIEFINPILLNKVYDGNVVNPNEFAGFDISNVRARSGIELLEVEFEIENNSANAGTYKVVLKRALTTEYGTAATMQFEYSFIIHKKEISYIAGTHQKIYDGNTNIQGVEFEGILEKDQTSMTLTTTFADANAGNNKRIDVVMEGVASVNYELALNTKSITGTILKRQVKLVAKNREVAYGTLASAINFEFDVFGYNPSIDDYTLPVDMQQFTGKGKVDGIIIKLNAGLYTISLDDVSVLGNNYEIAERQTAVLKVNALEVSATSDWTKVYDGTILYSGTITLIGVLPNDSVTAKAQYKAAEVGMQELEIELAGPDKDNYILITTTAQGEILDKTVKAIFDYGFGALDTTSHSVITTTELMLKYNQSIALSGDLPRPSATGYVFSGWYDMPNGQGTLFTLDTVINQDNWSVSQDEKTLYAYWTLAELEVQVGLIAYSSTDYEAAIDLAAVQAMDSGTVVANGQDIKTNNNIKVLFKDVLTLVAQPSQNYEFDGWYLSADKTATKLATGNGFVVNGNTLEITVRQEQRVYAKFKIITLGVNINFNANEKHVEVGGEFATGWTQIVSQGALTGLSKEFDLGTVVILPAANEISRTGYNFAGWFLVSNPSSLDEPLTQISVLEEMTVYAKWTPKTYSVNFVAATGTESESLLNSDKGKFANSQTERIISVEYDSIIEIVEDPQRIRYTFIGWFDSLSGGNMLNENTIFNFTENKTYYARWEEQTYSITINSSSLTNGSVEVVRSTGVLSVVNSGNTITVSLLASTELKLNIVPKKGYIAYYNFITAGENTEYVVVSNEQPENLILSISRFKEDIELNVKFLAGLLTVQFETPDTSLGSLEAIATNLIDEDLRQEVINDNERVVITEENGKQIITIKVFIGESVLIIPSAQKGYRFDTFINIPSSVSLVKQDNSFTFAKFDEDAVIVGLFTEQQHTITVKVGKDLTNDLTSNQLGSFASYIIDKEDNQTVVDSNVNKSNTLSQIQIKTNQKLVIEIFAKQGFKPAEDTSLYEFVKADIDALGGQFTFDSNSKFTFENFNSSGEIILLFERLLYTLNPVVAYENDNGDIIVVEENSSLYASITILTPPDDQTQGAKFIYEKEAEVSVSVQTGYHFVGWLTTINRKQILSTDATSFKLLMVDNTNVVALVKQNVYTVEYTQEGKGTFSVEQLRYQVKHGESLPEITVTSARGYNFQAWQIYNFETQSYVIDNDNLTETRRDKNITQNLRIKAVFVPKMVLITLNAKVFVDIDETGNYIYETFTTDVGYLQNTDTEESGSTLLINLLTTQTLNILAMPRDGYIISGWSVEGGKFATIKTTNNQTSANISEFYEDVVITVIFETKTNKFEIAIVSPTGESYTYNIKNAKTLAGFVDIDPTKIIASERYRAYVMAAVRTGNNFEVNFKVNPTYKVLKNQYNQPLIALKLQGQELQFITQNVNYFENEEQILIDFLISDFTSDGEVVLFVQPRDYQVLLIQTPEIQRYFNFNIEMATDIRQVLSTEGYLVPSRPGYTFKGWFTNQKAGEGKYMLISAGGQQVGTWDPNINTMIAEWEENFATINISYSPSINALSKSLDFTDNPDILIGMTGFTTFQYYGNNDVMFVAPSGKDGYLFSHWEQNGEIISTSSILSIRIPLLLNNNLQLNYTLVYKVRIRVASGLGGSATINNQDEVYLLPTQTAILLASVDAGYEFVGWSEGASQTILWTLHEQTINYSPTPKEYVASFIGAKVEIRIENPEIGGFVKAWFVDGGDPIEEAAKKFARYKQFLSFQIEEQVGYIFDFWTINGVNYNTLSTYQINLEDVQRGFITVIPNFKLRDVIYRIDFDKVRGTVKVNDAVLNGPQNLKTTYYATINFSFTANDRFQYESIRLITGSTNVAISPEYITVYNNTYTINMPSNMVSLGNNSTIRINFSMLYWLDVREEFEGLGTEDSPYIISNAKQFAQMAYLINNNIPVDSSLKIEYASAYYVLTTTVDFKTRFWTPIGTAEHPFDGTIKLEYDRNNIYLDREDYEVLHYSGLFGHITENAQIIVRKVELKTGIIVTVSVTAGLVLVSGAFILVSKLKKKKRMARSRVFPTERPNRKR